MTTTSGNIAGTIRPFGGVLKRQKAGNIYDIDEITPTGTKKVKLKGVIEMIVIDGNLFFKKKNDPSSR